MKLSDRFSRLESSPSKHYGASHGGGGGLDRGGGRSAAPPDLSGAYGGMISNRFVEPRSFLFDDYMGNDLHGTGRVDQHASGFRLNGGGGGGQRSRGGGYRRDFNNDYVDLDDDGYETYETRAPRGRQPTRAGLAGETRYVMVPVDSVRPRRRPAPRPRAETVQEVYEYYEPLPRPIRQNKPKIVKKVPIQNRISFKRPQRAPVQRFRAAGGRNAAARQTPTKKQQGGGGFANRRKSFVKGGINKTRSPLKKKRPEARPKVTVEALNNELDTYMRSGKHPRVEVSSA